MPLPHLFLDSSALVAGAISADGAARALLVLSEAGRIRVTISEQVVVETERALARKAPRALPYFRETLHRSKLAITRDPSREVVHAHLSLIAHAADVPVVLAAMEAKVDILVTLNRRHFIDDPGVEVRSGLRIATPGTALVWIRESPPGSEGS